MHYSLLVLADGTKTLDEIMAPYEECWDEDSPLTVEQEEDGETYWVNPNAKWDWWSVGGRWLGLIEASIGCHGERSAYDFEHRGLLFDRDHRPYKDGRYDVARVCDITSLNANMIHDVLTPDGVWHESEDYFPDGDEHGRFFVVKEGWHESLWERYVEPNGDCVAIVVDYHN